MKDYDDMTIDEMTDKYDSLYDYLVEKLLKKDRKKLMELLGLERALMREEYCPRVDEE